MEENFGSLLQNVTSDISAFIYAVTPAEVLIPFRHVKQTLWETCGLNLTFVAFAIGVAFFLYYYVWLPVDWDLNNVWYDYKNDAPQYKSSRLPQNQMLNVVLRRKRKGDLPPVFPNGWFAILESKELTNGQVKHVQALGENFAVMRTSEGQVHILDAYCSHLGANVAVGGVFKEDCLECPFHGENFAVMRSSEGQVHILDAYCPHLGANMAVGGVVKGDCLECPFHGWQFRGEDGTCSRVPYSKKVPKGAVVKTWPSDEVNGFIFVWYHAEGELPTWKVESIPEIEGGKLWYRGRFEKAVNTHIQDMSENVADYSHFEFVHTTSAFAGIDQRNYNRLLHGFLKHSWKADWTLITAPGENHKSGLTVEHSFKLFNKFTFLTNVGNLTQVGPGCLILKDGGMIVINTMTPVDPLVVRIVNRVYCPKHLFMFGSLILYHMSLMVERDILIWTHKKYAMKPTLAKEDDTILRHRRWYSQFYSENSPRYPLSDSLEVLEW